MKRWLQNRYVILALLTLLNLLNYVDRYVPSGALEYIGDDLVLNNFEKGIIQFAFLIPYTLIAPITGLFGDRVARRKLIGYSGILWSIATALAFFAPGYRTLLATRTLVGVGEAVFGILAPTVIIDLFEHERRSRMISIFYLSIPVGGALGYMAGGEIGALLSWRHAFLLVGLPGLVIAVVCFWIREPERGEQDEGVDPEGVLLKGDIHLSDLTGLLKNHAYLILIAGLTCATWVQGGLSWWIPAYFSQAESLTLTMQESSRWFGMVTVTGGMVAIPLGGFLSDMLVKRTEMSPALVGGAGLLLGCVPAYLALTVLVEPYCWIFSFLAIVGLFLNTGPINTAILEVVPIHRRAAAIAVSIFVIHMFGDVLSPPMIGWIADTFTMTTGMLLAIPYMLAGAMLWLFGAPKIPGARERALKDSMENDG